MSKTLQRLLRMDRKQNRGNRRAHQPSWFDVRRPHQPTVGLARDLLQDPAHASYVDAQFRALLDDPRVHETIQRDETPIPANQDREGYFDNRHLSYWLSGYDDLQVARNIIPEGALRSVLDFGGASGRFARQVALAYPEATVTIAELNVNHVAWVEKYFGRSVRAVKVSPYPHFTFPDNSFSLCVALSVFTHIDSYESGWLTEIHRVLVEGGYAFLTIHSEHTWPILPSQPCVLASVRKDPNMGSVYDPWQPMPDERIVFNWTTDSIEMNCNVFFHTEYIRRCWGKWFEIVDILPQAHHGFQTVVVLRKDSAR